MRRSVLPLLVLALSSGAAPGAAAQDPAPLAVGAAAPPFELTGATRDGVLPRAVRLADFRDKTLVIAFFYKARTKG